ncbi:hypothetical protein [Cohnella sp.]|uniref:hypothetical protein n=1 Tax=Cohnella sp. TaxID=1883426 RepID=UPI003564479C
MNQSQIAQIVKEMSQKVTDGTELTRDDVKRMAEAARRSGKIEHRALYSAVRSLLPVPAEGDEKITEDEIKEAAEKARKSGRIEDRVSYVAIKTKLQEQEESANK